MTFNKTSLKLYLVTDSTWVGEQTLEQQVKQSIEGGVTFIQYRDKHKSMALFVEEARRIQALASAYKVPFVINDNVEAAVILQADGVHVGQSDLNAKLVREAIGPDKILGISVQTVEQAILAESEGADYIGVGAVFNTTTKDDASEVTLDTLRAICQAVAIPVVAIGGIQSSNITQLSGSGIEGVAVISAILAQKDISNAAKRLLEYMEG